MNRLWKMILTVIIPFLSGSYYCATEPLLEVGGFNYFKSFNKFVGAKKDFTTSKSYQEYYDKYIFKPKMVFKMKYRINELCRIAYNDKTGIMSGRYHPHYGPQDVYPMLFYVDEHENLYFTDRYLDNEKDHYSEGKYKKFTKEGKLIDRNGLSKFYSFLESSNTVTACFDFYEKYIDIPDDINIWDYIDGEYKFYFERDEKDVLLNVVVTNSGKTTFPYPSSGTSERPCKIDGDFVYYIKDAFLDEWSLPDSHFSDKAIIKYNYIKEAFESKNLLVGTGFYSYVGADAKNRFYLYRATAVYPAFDDDWKEIFTPHFRTGELQIYNLEEKTITILEHQFPSAKGERPMWAFYVVHKDGTIYCDYILKDGHHVAKIIPDWKSVTPYPEYIPTIFEEDWKKFN